MAKRIFVGWLLVFLITSFTVIQSSPAGALNIGSISEKPNKEIKKFLPLANFLGKELQSHGIDKCNVVIAADIHQMASLLREGKVDIYIDSPFPSMVVSRLSKSIFLLRRWKKGVAEYHSVIFVRNDSGINNLNDIKGKIIAFEEPFSSSGYFLPKMFMEWEGLNFVSKKGIFDQVDSEEVGYIFCQEGNTIPWVFRNKVAVGAMDNKYFQKDTGENIDNFRVIFATSPIPRHIVSYRDGMDKQLVDKIKVILINMDKTGDGQKTLEAFEKTTKFDEIPHEAKLLFSKSQKFIDVEFELNED